MIQAPIICESRIERVVVYARGAVVTRRLSIPDTLPDGPVEVAASGITVIAEPGSARALAEGEREVVGLRVRRVVPAAQEPPGALIERVREHFLARASLKSEHAHMKVRREALAAVSLDPGMAKPWRRVDPAARTADALALSGLLSRELEAVDARIADLEEAIEKNERELQAAEIAASQGRSAELQGGQRPTLEVLVRLSAGGAMRSLAVEYVVRPARWLPAYAARFSAGATRVEWIIEALVAQASGEDWSHVSLALSTADLVHDARLPELSSLRLGRAQPPARKGYRPPPEGLDVMFEGYDRFVASLPAPGLPALQRRGAILPPSSMMQRQAEPAGGEGISSELEEGLLFDAQEEVTDAPVDRMTLPSADSPAALAPAYAQQEYSRGGGPPAGFAANAPPMEMPALARAAPAPAFLASAPQAAPARARSRGLLSEAVGAAGDALLQAKGGGGGSAQTSWEAAAPSAIEPADAWLDFDALHLAVPATKASRGRLVRDDAQAEGSASRAASEQIEHLVVPARACDPRDSRGQFDHRYDAGALADVPSNARLHRVSVAAAPGPATPRFITVPRESAEVYREVEIQNPFDAPLLSGPVEVFVDGALLTQSAITHVDRGGAILLGLGVEERLRVARNARVEEGSAGLLGGSTAVEHAVTIELASALGRDAEVSVIDRIPVSDDKDVELKTLYVRPSAEAYTQAERGQPVRKGLRWNVTVPAGGKARVELGYKIVLSSKSEIVGGNRRE